MDDIVQRLNQELMWIVCSEERKQLLIDARDEIKRLKKKCKDLTDVVVMATGHDLLEK